ncbi:MAG TPA: hypothetical protein DHU96_07980 [Actinobacteria bacterium]|nr:hypothetical protein [Actinomycetota bacterium]
MAPPVAAGQAAMGSGPADSKPDPTIFTLVHKRAQRLVGASLQVSQTPLRHIAREDAGWQNADRFGWDFDSRPRTEDDLYDLHHVREFAQQLGLACRTGHKLTLTAKGRRLADDPEQLWRAVAAFLLAGHSDFTAYTGELFLAQLLEADWLPRDEIRATVWTAAGEEGFRENRTGDPPSEDDVNWAIQDTGNLCRALGLLTVGADWRDRSCGLTETGKAAASEALRARAPGPRTIPWP